MYFGQSDHLLIDLKRLNSSLLHLWSVIFKIVLDLTIIQVQK